MFSRESLRGSCSCLSLHVEDGEGWEIEKRDGKTRSLLQEVLGLTGSLESQLKTCYTWLAMTDGNRIHCHLCEKYSLKYFNLDRNTKSPRLIYDCHCSCFKALKRVRVYLCMGRSHIGSTLFV